MRERRIKGGGEKGENSKGQTVEDDRENVRGKNGAKIKMEKEDTGGRKDGAFKRIKKERDRRLDTKRRGLRK